MVLIFSQDLAVMKQQLGEPRKYCRTGEYGGVHSFFGSAQPIDMI